MSDQSPEQSGAQREFDPDRDKAAVEKLKAWEKGTRQDPVMEGLGGEPWWRGFLKRKKPGQNSSGKPEA